MIEEVLIEGMSYSDLPSVLAIEKRSFKTPWNKQAFTEFMGEAGALYLVAKIDKQVVGYGIGWLGPKELHIGNLAVEEGRRRRGIGTLILKRLTKEAWKKGIQRMTLEVRVSNEPAISLYKKHEFREMAIRKGYYESENQDALVMMRQLDGSPTPATEPRG